MWVFLGLLSPFSFYHISIWAEMLTVREWRYTLMVLYEKKSLGCKRTKVFLGITTKNKKGTVLSQCLFLRSTFWWIIYLFHHLSFSFSKPLYIGYDLKLLSFFATSWSLHFLKFSLLPKKSIPISLFFTFLAQSHRILSLVMDLSCVQSECLMMFALSIGKFPIRYSTRSVSLTSWWMLNSPYHTTSIPMNFVFTFSTPHRDQFPACHRISLGSPIFQHSPFSHITKCTLACAGDSERYFMLLL